MVSMIVSIDIPKALTKQTGPFMLPIFKCMLSFAQVDMRPIALCVDNPVQADLGPHSSFVVRYFIGFDEANAAINLRLVE